MKSSIQAILFDMDDTLYDEMTFVSSGFWSVSQYVSSKIGIGPDTLYQEMLNILETDGRGMIFDTILEQHEVNSPLHVEEMVEIYRTHNPKISLYPDVVKNLLALRQRGLTIGIITDGLYPVQKRKVTALRLHEYVDFIVYTDELGNGCGKPHPAGFHRALEIMNLQPYEVLFVGNHPEKDIIGAQSVGIIPIHLCRGDYCCDETCGAIIHARTLEGLIDTVIAKIGCMSKTKKN